MAAAVVAQEVHLGKGERGEEKEKEVCHVRGMLEGPGGCDGVIKRPDVCGCSHHASNRNLLQTRFTHAVL
jgi:hypothetical protein